MTRKPLSSFPVYGLAVLTLAGTLAGCAPLIVGGAAVSTVLMASDRRSSGAQIDDETIQLRAAVRLTEQLGDQVHINITSYNRQVLLTGEVPTADAKQKAEQIVGTVDNVRGIVDEIAVMAPTTLPQRSGDVLITGKVRASLVDAQDLEANAFKVVTERGTVFLMGRVTQREADRATSIARQIGGVQRVVRMFEVLTPEELRAAGVSAPEAPAQPARVVQPGASASNPPSPEAGPPPSSGGAVSTPVR
jgi:osmotically-inducible protein OsmY